MALPKCGINIQLVPFSPTYAPIVHEWFYDVRYKAFFRMFGDLPLTIEDFKRLDRELAVLKCELFVILEKSTGKIIGLMTHECLKKKAGIYRWGIMLDADHQHKTSAIEAIILLSFYLFEHRGATKMAVEFLESDKHIQRITEQGGFDREGVLLKEAVIDGQFVDEVRYSISREKAYELYGTYYKSLDDLPENKK